MTIINLRAGSIASKTWIFGKLDFDTPGVVTQYKHDVYPPAGYTGFNLIWNSNQSDCIPNNIRYGVDICGVIGTAYFEN